mmetsp:Transcript_20955/g.50600  ORF Transcript_20955/g.50600 Transcript_20955/m.50600 type:complete len:120 (+) Transcript_20955:53-412(+)|eukprot:CAMPEP_0180135692 /NCGR_PEP_ID=MMETSP0986-20121125/10997_1 /TAXON_ID=697907 /ORGANISM="non described non described, Strain CCMP2293" /LENGTH=119 /DNA_ID=CAMNT_0022076469 /DNA_START=50 /DNA_END=409 /DNA_ORIENTATION=-
MSAKLAKKKMRELFADPGKPVAAGETKAASGPKRSAKRRRLKAFPQTFTARPAPDAKAKRLRANVERKTHVDEVTHQGSSLAAKALAMRCKVPLKTGADEGAGAADDDDLDDEFLDSFL